MKNSIVSVIIPFYNTESHLAKCISSVCNQTWNQLEIILINDGSTDGSMLICNSFASQDNRIVVLSQSNQGASMARNTGMNRAKGEYIMFVDSDDWVEPNMIERLLRKMEANNVDVVISQVPGDKQAYTTDKQLTSREALQHILKDQIWWAPYGKLFKAATLGSIRFPKPTISEDYKLMTDYLLQNHRVYYYCSSFYHRTTRQGSLSRGSLSERSFDEIENVQSVWNSVKSTAPEYAHYAHRNLAETLLKLLLRILSETSGSIFQNQKESILSSIRSNYFSFLCNSTISTKQKLLLTGCLSTLTANLTARLYCRAHSENQL